MDLKACLRKTQAYASFFNFDLFPKELHYWLITPTKINIFDGQNKLVKHLSNDSIAKRRQLSFSTLKKIKIAKKLGRIIGWLPGLRLLALTGSVAANNSLPQDDIDLLIITSDHSLWILRPIILLIMTLFFRRRLPHEDPSQTKDAFCSNLWLDTRSLILPVSKRSLYTAHEILQIIPIVDKHDSYSRFISQNSWTKKYLANAYAISMANKKVDISNFEATPPSLSVLIAPINYLFYLVQILYMLPKKTTEIVHLHAAFLHTNDYSNRIASHIGYFKDI